MLSYIQFIQNERSKAPCFGLKGAFSDPMDPIRNVRTGQGPFRGDGFPRKIMIFHRIAENMIEIQKKP